jgi:hypothetical protein
LLLLVPFTTLFYIAIWLVWWCREGCEVASLVFSIVFFLGLRTSSLLKGLLVSFGHG